MICEWFALCDHEAVGLVAHPIIGSVPVCQRCADKLDMKPEPFPANAGAAGESQDVPL